jgi:hypothetical protein
VSIFLPNTSSLLVVAAVAKRTVLAVALVAIVHLFLVRTLVVV